MMTEKEAATKWCPHSRVQTDEIGNATTNRHSFSRDDKCLGSACMYWRQGPARYEEQPEISLDAKVDPSPKPEGYYEGVDKEGWQWKVRYDQPYRMPGNPIAQYAIQHWRKARYVPIGYCGGAPLGAEQ